MPEYLAAMPADASIERCVYGAMLAIRDEAYTRAQELVATASAIVGPTAASLWCESYARTYPQMLLLQRLTELEEVVSYKQSDAESSLHRDLRTTWTKWLQGCQRQVDVWLPLLKVRGLVLTPEKDLAAWLKYSSLCRRSAERGGHMQHASQGLERAPVVLASLLGLDLALDILSTGVPVTQSRVAYAFKALRLRGERDVAAEQLQHLLSSLERAVTAADCTLVPLVAQCYRRHVWLDEDAGGAHFLTTFRGTQRQPAGASCRCV